MNTENKPLEQLDRHLAEKWISGIWRIPAGARPGGRKTKVQPHLWKWADVYDGWFKPATRSMSNAAWSSAEP
jgi:hypothetical protein